MGFPSGSTNVMAGCIEVYKTVLMGVTIIAAGSPLFKAANELDSAGSDASVLESVVDGVSVEVVEIIDELFAKEANL